MRAGSMAPRDRRWVRLHKRFKVTFGKSTTFTVDVCGGGFCALLLRAVAPGTPVDGTILVDGRDVPYTGHVVWAKAGDVRLGIRGQIGVGFASLDSALPVFLTGAAAGTFTTPRPGRTEARFSS
jgi:hypothetical protein